MTDIELLRAELERLFDLEELVHLSRDLLGFEAAEVGDSSTAASFAGALTRYCADHDAIEALCDAMLAEREAVHVRVSELRLAGFSLDAELPSGQAFGPFEVLRPLGAGRLGFAYLARRDGVEYRLKVLRSEATRDIRGLHRFLTLTRVVAGIEHPALPRRITVGSVGGRYYVAHEHVEGQPLSELMRRTGPMHLNDARPLLRAILEGLAELHDRRLAHGDLRADNVIVQGHDGARRAVLLDVGSDRLRARPRLANGRNELFATVVSPKTVAPEQIEGKLADARSDLYSFGAVLYEMTTGRPPFPAESALEAAFGHLSREPEPPSSVAPQGWVNAELDEFILALLRKDPAKRPQSARSALDALETLGHGKSEHPGAPIDEAELARRMEALKDAPDNADLALDLEGAVEQGADPAVVADAFRKVAELCEGDERREVKRNLLIRAARLSERGPSSWQQAEELYASLLELDADDEVAAAGLEEVRRKLGKFDELIEMFLARSEEAENKSERARAMSEIGRIYKNDLDDSEQALVAFTQAFCDDPRQVQYALEIESVAQGSAERWGEVLTSLGEVAADEALPTEERARLLNQAGRWYQEKLGRPDLAVSCYQAVITSEPANDAALRGITDIYRRAQQWVELGSVLLRRADAAADPGESRNLRAEAAQLLLRRLSDWTGARDIYERILEEDPSHEAAYEALSEIYEKVGDHSRTVKLLEKRLDVLSGEERLKVLCKLAETYEDKLDNLEEAIGHYESVLAQDAQVLDALKGLDRIYSKLGRFQPLLDNLREQIALAATPRQRIALWERVAAIYDEEFLDHAGAADAWEKVLEIDDAHESALVELVRHYRTLDRWEEVAALYERHIKLVADAERRLPLVLALARVLAEEVGSPERATRAYEMVLEIQPEHAGALEALAKLRETAGDADAALAAIDTLTEKATTPEARAEQQLRAARLLEARGNRDGAIDRYKRALDANPADSSIAAALRAAYVARGDINAALQLLDREIQQTEGDRAKAKLAGEMAKLAYHELKDDRRAEEAAKRALSFDPTNLDGLTVLGDIAFENKRYLEASKYYEPIAERADTFDKKEAARLLVRYVDALSHSDSTEKALAPMDTLLRLAPDDSDAVARVALVTFEHGSPKRAAELYRTLLDRFKDSLTSEQHVTSLYRYGESLRRSGLEEEAVAPLTEAADLDPGRAEPLVALALVHEKLEDAEQVLKVKSRHLDIATGEERAQLLIDIGEISANLGDRTRAAKSLVAALEEHPNDRRLLTKLMQLYSEEKDWSKLVEVVMRLAEFVDDPEQKAKYLQTAAVVSARQMGDLERAYALYEQVLELDPKLLRALDEAIELKQDQFDHEAVENLLKKKLEIVRDADDQAAMLQTFTALADLYEKHLGWTDEAIDALEAAQTLDPSNEERATKLTELYASNPAKYLEKAVASQAVILRENPYRQESYKLLRRLYTEVKRADASWCLCQALSVLGLADPDEERFYARMRPETAAPAQEAFADEDWLNLVMHPDCDPLLTSLFALVEPAVIMSRSPALAELGYEASHRIDPATYPYPVAQNLHYAAGVLGMDCPPVYQNTNDPGGLTFLHSREPSIVMGLAAHAEEVPPQAAAFIAARHLTYFRPGLYLRQLVSTGTGLKSWLFAAIKLTAPQFPVAPELEGAVNEALAALKGSLDAQRREHLTRVVSRMLQSGAALDLKVWAAGVDLTADRAGLIVGHDLKSATMVVKASDQSLSVATPQERIKELVLYGVSEQYFTMREKLGIGIDT